MNAPEDRETLSTERVWELFGARLESFLLRRVRDRQTAQDLLQETFLRIHAGLGGIDDEQRIAAWVFQIARNLVVDHQRRAAPPVSGGTDDPEPGTPDEGNLNDLVRDWIPALIARLPSATRVALELYELEGLSQERIADRLGLSLSGTKSRIQRGREKLKALLFECCSFERDRRGNVIGYAPRRPEGCAACEGEGKPVEPA